MLEKISGKVKDAVSDASEKLSAQFEDGSGMLKEYLSKASDLGDAARDKIASVTNELIMLSPLIEQTGFRTKAISIGVGIPPSVTLSFENFKDMTQAERQTVLDKHKDLELLGIIVKTLVAADQFQQKIQPGNFRFAEIQVEVGLSPSITLHMVPK